MLKAGLDGIKNNMQPPEAVEESLYEFDDAKLDKLQIGQLPASLSAALREMEGSDLMKETLGGYLFGKYLEAKGKECDEFRLHVSEWEIERYAEIY